MKSLLPIFLCFVMFELVAPLAKAAEFEKKLMFAKGESSATVSGAVVRGDRDVYSLKARRGQRITVEVSGVEKNVAFSVYASKSDSALQGTEEENDVTSWSGLLPSTGTYSIVVGGTRGNANYRLHVSIK